MYTLYQLTKRHMLLYFRDRSAVFFSLLSVLIVLILMLVFLGDMNKDNLIQLVSSAQGVIDEADANHVIILWTIAGILVVNAFTNPITMIGIYIKDKEEHKLESFYASPISRGTLILSYLIAAILTGFIMCLFILLLSALYVASTGYSFVSLPQLIQVIALILLCVFVSSCLILLVAQFVRSDRAWGAFSTLAGTLIGFLGGIYLPMGMLPSGIQTFLKALPFLHETALMREVLTTDAIQHVFETLPVAYSNGYQEMMGITIHLQGEILSGHLQIFVLCLCAIITLGISLFLLKKHTAFDR
ncbi:ABC transporter permease [[Eubacterium] hominis]|uniref:ABC transporter permease n=1 Tax=[Eubacterium] hominis TaxID=2764325 RepID=UPI003A4E62B3